MFLSVGHVMMATSLFAEHLSVSVLYDEDIIDCTKLEIMFNKIIYCTL